MASMEDLQNLLFFDDVTPDRIIRWLQGDLVLPTYADNESLRRDFVPLFTNFLNKHTQRYFEKSGLQVTGQTPKTLKYFSPIKNTNKIIRKSLSAKSLDFSNISAKNDLSSCDESLCEKLEDFSFLDSPETNAPKNGELSPVKEGSISIMQTSTPKAVTSLNSGKSISQNSTPVNSSTPKQSKGNRSKFRRRSHDPAIGDLMFTNSKKNVSASSWGKSKRRSAPIPVLPAGRPDVSSELEFPPVGSQASPKKSAQTKRIKPTLVTPSQYLAKQEFQSSLPTPFINPAFSSPTSNESTSLCDERVLLKKNKEKLEKEGLGAFRSPIDSFKVKSIADPEVIEALEEPSLSCVTNQAKLIRISNIYSKLIILDMVPNVIVELYFLFQLIILEKVVVKPLSSLDVFETYHNSIFFGISTLSRLSDLVCLLDPVTLKLLSENSRIQTFNPDFHKKLEQMLRDSSDASFESSLPANSSIVNVSFQTETDNNCNFPTVPAFQVFRKQRDLFYEILRCWQENHSSPGWSFTNVVGKKVEELMSFPYYPANMMHLAKLFTQQLVRTCKIYEDIDEDFKELSFISKLRHTDPSKWKSLKARLVSSQETTSPVPKPSFPGAEEFFKSFLVDAKNIYFHCHVKNALVARISEIIEEYFGYKDSNKAEVWDQLHSLRLFGKFLGLLEFLPYQTPDHLSENVLSTFVAERNANAPTFTFGSLLISSVKAGCLVMSIPWIVEFLSMVDPVAFHTKAYLTLAFELIYIFKRLRFPIVKSTCQCQSELSTPKLTKKIKWNSMNAFYIKVQLGWLFSLPNFPEGLFYAPVEEADINHKQYEDVVDTYEKFYSTDACKCNLFVDGTLCEETQSSIPLEQFESPTKALVFRSELQDNHQNDSLVEFDNFESPMKETPLRFNPNELETPTKVTPIKAPITPRIGFNKQYLDVEPFIGHDLLLLSCPYVKELTRVLRSVFHVTSKQNNAATFRKITPLSSSKKAQETSNSNIQTQLLENFFHNQPAAVKKCVDFIVERLVSNLVSEIRSDLMPKYKDMYLHEMRNEMVSHWRSGKEFKQAKLEEMCYKSCHSFITDVCRESQEITQKMTELEHLKSSVGFLMPQNITPGGRDMAFKIISATIKSRISSWLKSHLPPGYCAKDFVSSMQKFSKDKTKFLYSEEAGTSVKFSESSQSLCEATNENITEKTLENSGEPSNSNEARILPSYIIQKIKSHLLALVEKPLEPTANIDIEKTIEEIRIAGATKYAATVTSLRALESLTADLVSTYIVTKPTLLSKDHISKLFSFWSKTDGVFKQSSILLVLLSPRIFLLLAFKEENHHVAWKNIHMALQFLIFDSDILPLTDVKDSFMALLNETWPDYFLKKIGELLKLLSESAPPNADMFDRDIVEWMGWICTNLDDRIEDF